MIIDLGWMFIPFGIFIIIGSANAVNLTDGLDGLAIVPVMIVAMSFAFIAYLVGNTFFANYLQIQYIVNSAPFLDYDFVVNSKVLIPRPETEIIFKVLKNRFFKTALDVGTGSGNIAISLKLNNIADSITAIDCNVDALSIAKLNANNLNVKNIDFQQVDIFDYQSVNKYDLVVSNPPYISQKDYKNLPHHIRNYEPQKSLTDGKDGYSFYEYFAGLMEPWDGPAAMAFSDGRKIAATLDRNGLRPARYIVTADNTILMASEVGVLPSIKEEDIKIKWRLQPGKMLLVDLEEKRIISDDELKESLSSEFPYEKWINQDRIRLSSLRSKTKSSYDVEKLLNLQKCFGYSKEDIKFFLQPMMVDGQDPVGSMGRDIPLAALSDKSRLLYDYFFQKFAQVTNPPIDPIREEVVMSLKTYLGAKQNIFDFNNKNTNKLLEIDHPILTDNELVILKNINY